MIEVAVSSEQYCGKSAMSHVRPSYRSSRLPKNGPHRTVSNSESMHVLYSSLQHISSHTARVKSAEDGTERCDV